MLLAVVTLADECRARAADTERGGTLTPPAHSQAPGAHLPLMGLPTSPVTMKRSDMRLWLHQAALDVAKLTERQPVEQVLSGTTAETWIFRDRSQAEGCFAGLVLAEGGVVQIHDRQHPGDAPAPAEAPGGWTNPWWVGVGPKS